MRAIAASIVALALVTGCAESYGNNRPPTNWRNYDYNRPDPAYGRYDASRYYRTGPGYRQETLTRNDRIYRGQDGRYYCRRSDGTTGLIVGALAGGLLGNLLTRGDSKTLGTIIGAAAGAAIGKAVDSGDAHCR